MALSEWDKKHLTGGQQRAIVAYTQQYDSAMAAGNRNAAQKAHEGAEAIRKQAGWTGGTAGTAAPSAAPDFQAAQSSTNIFTKYGLTENGRKQTTPLTAERADELDKRNVESASRQAAKRSALDHEIEWQARAFGTGEANTFLSTGGAAHSGSGRSFGLAAGRGVGGHSGSEAPKSVADQIALREQSRGDSSLDERLRNILSGSMKLYGAQGVGVAEAAANVEQAYRQARPQDRIANIKEGGQAATVIGGAATKENADQIAQRIQRLGSKLKASGAADVERAQEGLNRLGRFGVNAGVAVTQMGADVGLGLLTGGGSMLPMAARSFGGGVQEAREKGYSVKQQLGIGLANAATEYMTEKLFGGNPAYDRSAGWVNQAVDRLTRNKTWNTKLMNALSSLPADMLSEGLEEVLADIVEPAAEWAITGNRPAYELDQIVEDGLTGVLLSAAGKGGGVALGELAKWGVGRNAPEGLYSSALRRALDAGAYAGGETLGGELGHAWTEAGYETDWGRVGRSGLDAAAFAALDDLIGSAVTSWQNKAQIKSDLEDVKQQYEAALRAFSDPHATPEEQARLAQSAIDHADWARYRLDELVPFDAQGKTTEARGALQDIVAEMKPYAAGGAGWFDDPFKPVERNVFLPGNGQGLAKDTLPDYTLEGFLPTKDYIQYDGSFDLTSAKADYQNVVLQSMPEKNRMLLQQSVDAVEHVASRLTDGPIGYDPANDTIIFDPEHPSFANIDFDVEYTHELSHRVDRFFVRSWENPILAEAIEDAGYASDDVWRDTVAYCDRCDEDGFLSDIFSALCESKYDYQFGHSKEYWAKPQNKSVEIFANLFSLEALNDTEKLRYLSKVFPELVDAYDSLQFWIR